MQKYDQENFFKRCVSYSSKVYDIKNTKGDRDYDIPPVYLIGILAVDCFERSSEWWRGRFISDYTFREKSTGEIVCETISLIFVELKRFDKPLEECKDIIDKWCYALKYMSRLDELPSELQNRVFKKLFKAAEIAHFSTEKRNIYQHEMITERDEINIRRTAEKRARAEGRTEGRLEVSKKMIENGMSIDEVVKYTGIPIEEISSEIE